MQMKITKCDEEDFNYCWALRLVEDLVIGRFFMDGLNDWMDWEDGEDKEINIVTDCAGSAGIKEINAQESGRRDAAAPYCKSA